MCMCFLLFFFLGFLRWFKVHGKHPVRIVVCVFFIGLHASARMTACCGLSWGGLHRHSFFFDFCACKTSPGQAIVALLLWQKRRADQDQLLPGPIT